MISIHVSKQLEKAVEIVLILFLYNFAFWYVVFLEKNSYLAFWAFFLLAGLVVYSVWKHWEGFQAWGIRIDNLAASFKKTLLPLVVVFSTCIIYGFIGRIPFALPRWDQWILFPVGGVLQQLLFQGYFYNRYETIVKQRAAAIGLTAFTFSLFHIPNMPLMILTFLGGIYVSWFFSKYRNLIATGVLHGLVSLALTFTLEVGGVIKSYRVGPEPLYPLRKTIHESLKPDSKIAVYQSSSIPRSFYRSFDREVAQLKRQDEFKRFLEQKELCFVAIPANAYNDFLPNFKTAPPILGTYRVWKRKFPKQSLKTIRCIITLNFKKLDSLYRREVYLVTNRPLPEN